MPATAQASGSTGTSSQPGSVKIESQVKQIGTICVAGPPTIHTSSVTGNSVGHRATAIAASNASGTTTAFYPATSVAPAPIGTTLQSLGLMVTRFSGSDAHRQPTVILHPRPIATGMRTGTNVVVTSTTAARGVPLTTGQGIPIRLQAASQQGAQAVTIGQAQGSTIQVMNLSVSNPTGNATHQASVKQICTPTGRLNFPLDGVNLVVAGEPGRVLNVKPATTIQHAKIRTAGNQPAKVINLTGTPVSMTTSNSIAAPHQVTRLGIISQLPGGASNQGNAKPILNITAINQKPAVILNPQTPGLVTSGTTVHSVVSAHGKTVIPVNQAIMTLTAATHNSRHTVISSTSAAVSAPQQIQYTNAQQQKITPASTVVLQTTHSGVNISSPMKQNVQASPVKQAQLQQGTPSSPRPSILIRKRIGNDGLPSSVVNNLFKTTPTKVPQPAAVMNESVVIKTETIEADPMVDAFLSQSTLTATPGSSQETGATPRKKPRKQLLEPFNLSTSQNIKLMGSSDNESNREKEDIETDNASEPETPITVPVVTSKKPRPSLLGSYSAQWKSLQYHFLRYSDVKPKPEKKLTLSELSNEGLQKKNGWKIHHLATQMEEMSDNESEIHERLTKVLDTFERMGKTLFDDNVQTSNPGQIKMSDRLTDLVRGNLQRSSLFQEQISESKSLLVKLTQEHRERVGKLTKKCANKRTFIK
ncbi:putative histone deacetylase complex subunit [Halotydeus destructor]|nr:putative histone deacetylase complex subunit [Halotydeus destructor]